MKIVVTGSHFTPAQAVIEKLQQVEDIEIIYFGRKYARDDDKALSAESKVLPKLGIKFIPIIAGKFNRFFSLQSLVSLFKTPIGFIQSFYYLLKEQPDLILSFGGFTGMPVVVCGWFLSVPSIIHEQGLKMGLSNSISSLFAYKVAVSFEDFKSPFFTRDKIIVTGNPVRSEMLDENISPDIEIKNFIDKAKNKPLILITAGNQGSHKINLMAEDKLSELTKEYALIHQTGESKYDDFSNLKKNASENYLVKKWIAGRDLSYILENADLVVCRGGINTLTELALKSTPALIIPIPVGSEQKENADYFSKLSLGEVLEDKTLTPDLFLGKIKQMLKRKAALKNSARNAKDAVIPGAAEKLVQEVLLFKNTQENLSI